MSEVGFVDKIILVAIGSVVFFGLFVISLIVARDNKVDKKAAFDFEMGCSLLGILLIFSVPLAGITEMVLGIKACTMASACPILAIEILCMAIGIKVGGSLGEP